MYKVNEPIKINGKMYGIFRDKTGLSRQEFEGRRYIVGYDPLKNGCYSIIFTGALKGCKKYIKDLEKAYNKQMEN